MQTLTISQVARRFGLRSSALRYYEQIGILAPVNRVSGRRRYDSLSLRRLAVIQRARDAGFALEDIREPDSCGSPRAAARVWESPLKRGRDFVYLTGMESG
jgi:DNA-binding transcriptional MerR regulator